MMIDDKDPFGFSDLASDDVQIKRDTSKKPSPQQKFECVQCAGSGLWQGGRRNVHGNANCNTCAGKGYVLTDPRKLQQRRMKAAQKKLETYAQFVADNEDVIKEIGLAADWSDFARSLSNQLQSRKPWSDKQLASARSMAAKLIANREKRDQERKQERAAAPVVDLSPIKEMFDRASENGYKKPTYRAEGFVISLAPSHGMNAGHLYVKSENNCYMGKISPEMKFFGTRDSKGSGVEEALKLISQDPLSAALRHGQRTGRCACCGRELTKHSSIDAGIGPICKEKWGL